MNVLGFLIRQFKPLCLYFLWVNSPFISPPIQEHKTATGCHGLCFLWEREEERKTEIKDREIETERDSFSHTWLSLGSVSFIISGRCFFGVQTSQIRNASMVTSMLTMVGSNARISGQKTDSSTFIKKKTQSSSTSGLHFLKLGKSCY